MRNAIAWDIDGTLIDSEPLHLQALLAVADAYGVDLHALPLDTFRGVHIDDVWRALSTRFDGKVGHADWCAQITEVYIDRVSTLAPQPGAIRAMETLASRGIAQVCVSNSNRRVVDANIRALGIAGQIEFSISLDDVTLGKPHPEPYLLAARRLALPPARMAAVEDSAAGAASARAAGLFVIGYAPAGSRLDQADTMLADLGGVPQQAARLLALPETCGAGQSGSAPATHSR